MVHFWDTFPSYLFTPLSLSNSTKVLVLLLIDFAAVGYRAVPNYTVARAVNESLNLRITCGDCPLHHAEITAYNIRITCG
jgi:hypothetical protein